MASRVSAVVRLTLCVALALVALGGCSKKVTAPNSRTIPEGDQNGQLLMMGWPEQPTTWFVVGDPSTPTEPGDDFLYDSGNDYWADPNGVRSSTLDVSTSTQLQPFVLDANGNVQELFDFPLEPSLRFVGRGLDLFDFEDFNPIANPVYYGRGAVDGVSTQTSPVSNRLSVTGAFDDNLDFTPDANADPGDSVLDVVFTEDPRAAFYLVEIDVDAGGVVSTGSAGSFERRIRAIPAPLTPGSRPLRTFLLLMLPGQGLQGLHLAGLSRVWPAFFYVRVTAFDGNGQMVNRLNDYLITDGRDGDLNLSLFEPTGGTVVMLHPYPEPGVNIDELRVRSRDEAFAILNGLGGTAPGRATSLASSPAAKGSASVTSSRSEIELSRLGSNPLFSTETLRRNIARARQVMEQRAAGTAGATSPALKRITKTR